MVLTNGKAAILRPPGFPFGYKAELYAFVLACRLAIPGSTIFTDSKAVLSAISGSRQRVVLGHLVQLARDCMREKSLRCQHVQAHVGHAANEHADLLAKRASHSLPPQRAQIPRQEWDVCFEGEKQSPPHKVWARHLIPHFSHEGVHWWSWAPLHRSISWAKWFFGGKCVKGLADPRSFWKDRPSRTACPHCALFHNQSIHGMVAYCQQTNPLVGAWLGAWGEQRAFVSVWRSQACRHDRQLSGKLLCPITLVNWLIDRLGYRVARRVVAGFYGHILSALSQVLPKWTMEEKQGFKCRLDPYRPEGWDVVRTCLP